jgi:hypothetical protein
MGKIYFFEAVIYNSFAEMLYKFPMKKVSPLFHLLLFQY